MNYKIWGNILQKGNKEFYKEGKNCKIIKERNYEKIGRKDKNG